MSLSRDSSDSTIQFIAVLGSSIFTGLFWSGLVYWTTQSPKVTIIVFIVTATLIAWAISRIQRGLSIVGRV